MLLFKNLLRQQYKWVFKNWNTCPQRSSVFRISLTCLQPSLQLLRSSGTRLCDHRLERTSTSTSTSHATLGLVFSDGWWHLAASQEPSTLELLREWMSSPFWKRSVHHATALTTLYSMYHSYSYCKWFLDGVLDTLNLMIYTKVQFHYIILKHTQLFQTWVHAINVQFVFELYLDAYNLQDTRRCTALVPTLISTVHGIY